MSGGPGRPGAALRAAAAGPGTAVRSSPAARRPGPAGPAPRRPRHLAPRRRPRPGPLRRAARLGGQPRPRRPAGGRGAAAAVPLEGEAKAPGRGGGAAVTPGPRTFWKVFERAERADAGGRWRRATPAGNAQCPQNPVIPWGGRSSSQTPSVQSFRPRSNARDPRYPGLAWWSWRTVPWLRPLPSTTYALSRLMAGMASVGCTGLLSSVRSALSLALRCSSRQGEALHF